MAILTDTEKEQIAEAAETILREDFTSKPGWNWPPDKASRCVLKLEPPDEEGGVVIYVVVKRVDRDNDDDEI